MTDPQHDEGEGAVAAAHTEDDEAVTSAVASAEESRASDADNADAASATADSKKMLVGPVHLVFGKKIAEGGFCSIWDVKSIRDAETNIYLLGFPEPEEDALKPSSRTLSSGTSGSHKRGSSLLSSTGTNPNEGQTTLPPLVKSVEMTWTPSMSSDPKTTSTAVPAAAMAEASLGESSRRSDHVSGNRRRSSTSSFFRRSSTSSDVPPSVDPAFLKRSSSKEQNVIRKNHSSTSSTNDNITERKYVIKFLKDSVLQNPAIVNMGLKDMKIEIEMLQRFRHPNIIGMRAFGTMEFDIEGLDLNQDQDDKESILGRAHPPPSVCPFVVLDRLGETLEDKVRYWTIKHLHKSTLLGKLVTHRNHNKNVFCGKERWQTLCDIASALAYLHKRRIIYRDLKPDNVAFDCYTDSVKLLDFGLAKDLSQLQPSPATGLYRLTGLTGSARYMAPEVAREDEYDETCDVYSLSLVMWQVMALETPYAKYSVSKMFQLVYDCPHVRPSLDEWQKAPPTSADEVSPTQQLTEDLEWFARLLSKMWSPLVEERPSMRQVYSAIKKKLDKYDRAVSSLDSGPEE